MAGFAFRQPVLEKPGGIPLEWILMTVWAALGVVFSSFAASRGLPRPESSPFP